jgi:serine/threonine protein kinase
MSLNAGSRLGPYEIASFIGAGGMGEVYRARDTRLERDVAIKVLTARLELDSRSLSRFRVEAKAIAALSHPNILAIFDAELQQPPLFLVTEFLEGETLRALLERSQPSWRPVAELGASVADALAAAHSTGVIHRDLKPENLFLTNRRTVKILASASRNSSRDSQPPRRPPRFPMRTSSWELSGICRQNRRAASR